MVIVRSEAWNVHRSGFPAVGRERLPSIDIAGKVGYNLRESFTRTVEEAPMTIIDSFRIIPSVIILLSSAAAAGASAAPQVDVGAWTPDGGTAVGHYPAPGVKAISHQARPVIYEPGLCFGWPVYLAPPGAGFPYTPTLWDADGDGADEIFLTGGHTFGLKGDGTFLPGWPTQEMQYMGYGTNGNKPGPSIADLENDGSVEILWTERDWWAGSSYLWCFNGKNLDGTDMPGFPQEAPDDYSNALDTPFVLGDTDGDGDLEAWGAHTLGNTFVHYRISGFDHQGNRLFTTDLDPDENTLSLYFGNLDGDGVNEMFAVSLLDGAYRLHVFDEYGGEAPGYPIVLHTLSSAYNMFGPPVPADLDDDGDLEILLGYWGGGVSSAACYHHDGASYDIFPVQIATSSQLFYLGLGDVTGDGGPELIALENHLSGDYRVFVIDVTTGSMLPGWPFGVPDWPKGFPAVVDVDADGVQDVCFTTGGGELYAVSGEGALTDGYPKHLFGDSISGVAAGDIDGDGRYELVAATWDGWVYAWNTPTVVSADNADWPMRGVNARNTGVFGDRP